MGVRANPKAGDYVVATKYSDGDPKDHFCVGFLERIEYDAPDRPRYFVVDGSGKQFRLNGFRHAKRIDVKRGKFIVENLDLIEQSARSVWWWVRKGPRALKEQEDGRSEAAERTGETT